MVKPASGVRQRRIRSHAPRAATPARSLRRRVGVPLLPAPPDEEPEFLATTAFQRVLALIRGDSLKQKPPVKSMAGLWLPREQDAVGNFFGLAVIGGPEKVRSRLEILLEQTGVDEIIFTSDIYDHELRLRSLEIVAGLR